MSITIPDWLVFPVAVGIVIWIFVGIQAYKAIKEFRETNGNRSIRFQLPPPPSDDADWWKREG